MRRLVHCAIVTATDVLQGGELEIRTRSVVDATGVWAAEPDHPFASPSMRLLPSRGAHLVVARDRIPAQYRVDDPGPGQGRVLHPVARSLADRHDRRTVRRAAGLASPRAPREVDELLATVNATLDVDLTRADVVGTYAGLRPLIAPSGGSTVKASREHRITAEQNGVVRVAGGKYTTYRVMARDVIDAALGRDGARSRPSAYGRTCA